MDAFNYFHVPPSGGLDFIFKNNLNIMSSYINPKDCQEILDDSRLRNDNCSSKVFIDSGAFSYMRTKKRVDLEKYIEFINANNEKAFVFAPLDTIPYKTTDFETSARLSMENFVYMMERINCPDKLVYVYHQSEDLKWLKEAIEMKINGKMISYICLSNRIDIHFDKSYDFFQKCFAVIKSSKNPDIRTHAMGIGSTYLLKQFPFFSADSSSAIQSARYGRIVIIDEFGNFQNLTVARKANKKKATYSMQCRNSQDRVRGVVKDMGFDWDEILDSSFTRALFNMKMFDEFFVKKYKCVYKGRKLLF